MGSFYKIASIDPGSTQATVSFTSIPATYKHLELSFFVKNSLTQQQSVILRFNGDANTNYAWTYTYLQASASVGGNGALSANSIQIGHTNLVTSYWIAKVVIPEYTHTGMLKQVRGEFSHDPQSTGQVYAFMGGVWNSTAAINRIDLLTGGGDSFTSETRIALYGVS